MNTSAVPLLTCMELHTYSRLEGRKLCGVGVMGPGFSIHCLSLSESFSCLLPVVGIVYENALIIET